MASFQVKVNEVRIGVESHGEEQTKAKNLPTLVLIHGFTGSAAGWGSMLNRLAAFGMRVIALDMLGHGQSDIPEDWHRYSMEHCREDILGVLDKLDVNQRQTILLGYSMGGRIALYTAFSRFFRGLILESASPGLANADQRDQQRRSDDGLAEWIEREGIETFVDYWENLPLFASRKRMPDEVQQVERRKRLQNSPEGLARSLRGVGIGVQPFLQGSLSTLLTPVLLIVGQLDPKFSNIAVEMARLLPFSQLQIVQQAGHTVHLERPEEFLRLVRDFCLT